MEKFSVLMPVSNKEIASNLKRCLDSIFNQTLIPNEVVVILDGKIRKELKAVLKNYKLKIIELKKNKGIGYALNVGIQNCKYNLIARMDSDDISMPNRFELQIKKFKENKNLSILGGQILEFDNNHIKKIRKVPTEYKDILKYSKKRNPFNHMSVMYKKSTILALGNYTNSPHLEDYYLWIKALQNNYYVENLNEILILANNTTTTIKNRGGIKYIKPTINLQTYLLKSEYINIFEFLKNTLVRVFVALVPNKIRIIIYSLFLREKYTNKNLTINDVYKNEKIN